MVLAGAIEALGKGPKPNLGLRPTAWVWSQKFGLLDIAHKSLHSGCVSGKAQLLPRTPSYLVVRYLRQGNLSL